MEPNIRYCCPNCKTNKTRFNLINQVAQPIKKDAHTGVIVEYLNVNQLQPFHLAYNGPSLRVQCAACGLIEDEKTFASFGSSTLPYYTDR
ncbi:MAG: DNA alkylation repair protein [Bacillus sp. (in: firmicutes)]